MSVLPAIPVLDVGPAGPGAVLMREKARARELLEAAQGAYGRTTIAVLDRLSRQWLARCHNPYLNEIDSLARQLKAPGAHFLNLSFEWTCTSAAVAAPEGPRLLRVMDWDLAGLGRHLLAIRQQGRAGAWLNLGWPGFVGVVNGFAPGRFAAAINQPPMVRRRLGLPWQGDWALNRLRLARQRALPPAHLLRRVFDHARDYGEARHLLAETPVALPCLFTLAGGAAGEGCVIERLENRHRLHPMPAVIANHWLTPEFGHGQRSRDSHERLRALQVQATLPPAGLDWVQPPILSERTRLAMVADPASGRLIARAYEADGPVSADLVVEDGKESLTPAAG